MRCLECFLDEFAAFGATVEFPCMTAWRKRGHLREDVGDCPASLSDRDGQRDWVTRAWAAGYEIKFSNVPKE